MSRTQRAVRTIECVNVLRLSCRTEYRVRNTEYRGGRYSECFIVLRQWSFNRDRALVAALARCPLLGMSVKRGSTVSHVGGSYIPLTRDITYT